RGVDDLRAGRSVEACPAVRQPGEAVPHVDGDRLGHRGRGRREFSHGTEPTVARRAPPNVSNRTFRDRFNRDDGGYEVILSPPDWIAAVQQTPPRATRKALQKAA